MKATINGSARNARNLSYDKELIAATVAVDLDTGCEPVVARWYMGRSRGASRVYCSVWVHGQDVETSGRGWAGGGGYCKKSAAFAEALGSAGVALSEDVSGRGLSAVREAVLAICAALGATRVHLVEFGG